MLTITSISVKSFQTPFGAFAERLKKQYPSFFRRIGQLSEKMMIDLRNREDHFKMSLPTEADADKMLAACKEMISLIYERPEQHNPA